MIAARTRLSEERGEGRTKRIRGRSQRVSGSKETTLRRIDSRETTTLASLRRSLSSVRSPPTVPRISKLTKRESKWTRVKGGGTRERDNDDYEIILIPLPLISLFSFLPSFLFSDLRAIVALSNIRGSPLARENAEEMEIGSKDQETQTERVHTIRAARSCPFRKRRIHRLYVGDSSRNKAESTFGWIHRKASDNLIYEKGKASGSPSYVPLTERFRWRYVGPRKAR